MARHAPDRAGRVVAGSGAPSWNEVLRALREARGVTLDGWGARLGVSRRTVQRWERGERAPDPGAEAAIIAYCRDAGLLRPYDRGPLAGLSLTAELLRDLFAEARWRGSDVASDAAPSSMARRADVSQSELPRVVPSNLPAHLTSFVGRERELAAVRRLQAGTRLLTLTGAGGCGKTRLALELARELLWAYPHGVWFVDLAPLTDPALMPQAVAAALQIHTSGQRPVAETLADVLKARHILLVLDNCEQLLPACAGFVEALLRACPQLEVVSTSREPLGIAGETVWRVPPLSLTSRSDGVARSDAVLLFIDRARSRLPDLAMSPGDEEAVAAICRLLDGMPLAIELAAARVNALSVTQIAERLHDRFRLLAGGRLAVPRHRTLRTALDWSHELLGARERSLLRGLSVFVGGFTLEAAELVCGGEQRDTDDAGPVENGIDRCSLPVASQDVLDLVTRLVDKSMVDAERHEQTVRYRMLETVRQYAAEKLDDEAEATTLRDRHLSWCLALAEAAEAELHGPRAVEWLARLEREHDNVRAALAWSLSSGGRAATESLRLASSLTRFWDLRGYAGEGHRWLRQALAADVAAPAPLRARALRSAGTLAHVEGDFSAAESFFSESLLLCRSLGDDECIARAEANLGWLAVRRGDYTGARALLESSLTRGADRGDKPLVATAQTILGQIALRQGDYERARAHLEAALAIQRSLGDKHGIAGILDELATVAGEQGDDARQSEALAESLALFRELGHRSGIALILGGYGIKAWLGGDAERTEALLQESLTLYREVGERAGVARLLGYQSVVALFLRDYDRAEPLIRECLALYREAGDDWAIGRYLPVLAGVMAVRGQAERSASLFGAAAALRERLGAPLPQAFRSAHDRTVAAVRGALGEERFKAAWSAGEATTRWDDPGDMWSGDALV